MSTIHLSFIPSIQIEEFPILWCFLYGDDVTEAGTRIHVTKTLIFTGRY